MLVLMTIMPVMMLIFTGFALKFSSRFDDQFLTVALNYVVYIAVPALLIHQFAISKPSDFIDLPFMLAFSLGGGLLFLLVSWLLQKDQGEGKGDAIINALTTCSVNVGFIGIPVVVSLFGKTAIKPAFLCLVSVLLIIFPLAYYLLAKLNTASKKPMAQVGSLLSNPMLTAPIIGIAISSLSINLPKLVLDYLMILAAPMSALALLAVGYSIDWVSGETHNRKVLILSTVKLLVMPALVFILAVLLGNEPFNVIILVLIAALPTAKTVLVICHTHKLDNQTVSSVITLTTLLCPITIAFWLMTLKYYYHAEFIKFLAKPYS